MLAAADCCICRFQSAVPTKDGLPHRLEGVKEQADKKKRDFSFLQGAETDFLNLFFTKGLGEIYRTVLRGFFENLLQGILTSFRGRDKVK
jgi:hypothetical protein